MKEAIQYIDNNKDRFIEDLKRLVRQPSISAQKKGIAECAELVRKMMDEVGIDARIIPVKDGSPVVFGELKSKKSSKTLAFYDHYDVQPPEPFEEWISPPFEPEIREGRIYGRGVADNKGNTVARMKAIEAIMQTSGELPVNLKFLVEGEEEVTSPHLGSFVKENMELLKADGYLWEYSEVDEKDRPEIELGVKGSLHVELTARGANTDVHSSKAALIPNPAWRLTWALTTIKNPDETIKIEGFYDDVRAPTEEEIRLVKKMPFEEKTIKKDLGLKAFARNLTGVEAVKSLYLGPACTICGLTSGYQGLGSKTVLPCLASAKLDFRLVPNQKPDDIFHKLRLHLEKQGFGDIEAEKLGGYEPSRVSAEDPFAKLVIDTARDIYGVEPVIHPTSIGASPVYTIQNWMHIPVATGGGVSYPGSKPHAPNENIRVNDYIRSIKFVTTLMHRFK